MVVARRRCPLGLRPGAGGGDLGGAPERGRVDQGGVGAGDVHVAADDRAGVGGVGQDVADLEAGPRLPGGGGDAAAGEFVGDGAGAEPIAGVEPEHLGDVGCFAGVRDELGGGRVDGVAVGAPAAGPFAFGGFGVHAAADAVDDGLALELGEHAQELDEHPADGGGGVERLGRGSEGDAGVVEAGEQVQQVGQAAGEPVDPVDQQHVIPSGLRCPQGPLQVRPLRGRSGRVVAVGGHQGPAGLGLDVGGQRGLLGVDGERLVLVVGGAAQVDRDPAGTGRGAEDGPGGTAAGRGHRCLLSGWFRRRW